MASLVHRSPQNPLLKPADVTPSHPGLRVECLLNPGVFTFNNQTHLLVRVAERPAQTPGRVSFPIIENNKLRIIDLPKNDPDLDTSDPREFKYKGEGFLSTLSHLRLFKSADGLSFTDTGILLHPEGAQESFGIEDCRVATMKDGTFALTYTAVAPSGYGVALRTTRDWKTFQNHGLILPPANKDCALFDEKINNSYHCLHRPSCVIVGGHDIWHASSPDMRHWGNHTCIARTRKNSWDEQRIGAGASPIRTEHGWLAIYHGADHSKRYALGALLLDLGNPTRVIARSKDPIMTPDAPYEQNGFFGRVVFTNGHVLSPDNDTLHLYYGASDTVICTATLSLQKILSTL